MSFSPRSEERASGGLSSPPETQSYASLVPVLRKSERRRHLPSRRQGLSGIWAVAFYIEVSPARGACAVHWTQVDDRSFSLFC